MKKLILSAVLGLITTGIATSQVTVQGSKFSDNWSVGLSGGIVTPLKNHAFWGDSRGLVNLHFQKDITPILGFGFEAEASFNTSSWYNNKSTTMFDHSYLGVYGAVNLMNAFGGFNGEPRLFEMELLAGTGWLHAYTNHGYPRVDAWAGNSWGNKLGINFNFNLGDTKAWTVSVKPSILWNMGAKTKYYSTNIDSYSSRYNANAAVFELLAGVTYHFGNSNGTHSFVACRLFDQSQVDDLNAQINGLRNNLANCNAKGEALRNRAASLQSELDACNSRPKVVKEVAENLNNVRYIFFQLGSSYIQANQKPNLELVANSLKSTAGSTVEIKGYASPEGSKAFNQRLSTRRAEVVKNSLIKEYKIDPSRITTEGMGVGDIFNVASWNRVAVCTVNNK